MTKEEKFKVLDTVKRIMEAPNIDELDIHITYVEGRQTIIRSTVRENIDRGEVL